MFSSKGTTPTFLPQHDKHQHQKNEWVNLKEGQIYSNRFFLAPVFAVKDKNLLILQTNMVLKGL